MHSANNYMQCHACTAEVHEFKSPPKVSTDLKAIPFLVLLLGLVEKRKQGNKK